MRHSPLTNRDEGSANKINSLIWNTARPITMPDRSIHLSIPEHGAEPFSPDVVNRRK